MELLGVSIRDFCIDYFLTDPNQEEINIQQGIKFMTMGAMMSIRNPASHGDREQISVGEAMELIGFASYLLKLIDKRIEETSS